MAVHTHPRPSTPVHTHPRPSTPMWLLLCTMSSGVMARVPAAPRRGPTPCPAPPLPPRGGWAPTPAGAPHARGGAVRTAGGSEAPASRPPGCVPASLLLLGWASAAKWGWWVHCVPRAGGGSPCPAQPRFLPPRRLQPQLRRPPARAAQEAAGAADHQWAAAPQATGLDAGGPRGGRGAARARAGQAECPPGPVPPALPADHRPVRGGGGHRAPRGLRQGADPRGGRQR